MVSSYFGQRHMNITTLGEVVQRFPASSEPGALHGELMNHKLDDQFCLNVNVNNHVVSCTFNEGQAQCQGS